MQMLSMGDTTKHVLGHQQLGVLSLKWEGKMSLNINVQVAVPFPSSNCSSPSGTLERNQPWKVNIGHGLYKP
jgi:hypothetical protein